MQDVPLDAYRFGADLESDGLSEAHGLGTQGALLVRPDGFVAWRDENASDDPEAELERALSGLLCLTTQTSRGVAQRYFRAGGASF